MASSSYFMGFELPYLSVWDFLSLKMKVATPFQIKPQLNADTIYRPFLIPPDKFTADPYSTWYHPVSPSVVI
jgi:hypothetical protein